MGHSLATITLIPPSRITRKWGSVTMGSEVLTIKCVRAKERVHCPGKQSAEADRLLPLPSVKTEKNLLLRAHFWRITRQRVQLYFHTASIHWPTTTTVLLSGVQNLGLSAVWQKRTQKTWIYSPQLDMCEKEKKQTLLGLLLCARPCARCFACSCTKSLQPPIRQMILCLFRHEKEGVQEGEKL